MTEKTIEQKATELFIARYKISAEEFKESEYVLENTLAYRQCVCYFNLLELGESLAKIFQNIWDEWKGFASEIANIQDSIEKKKLLQSKWKVIRDTTVKSQVIDNKPKHLVKKIIR